MSFKPHWCDQYLSLQNGDVDIHIPLIPLHQTFPPLSSKEALEMSEWLYRGSYSPILEESHLSDVGWWWTICTLWCFLNLTLFPKFVPLGWWWCTWPTYHAQPYREESCLKVVSVEDSWVSCPLVPHEVERDALSNLTLHFVLFLLPLVLHLPPPLSQDQVTLFQWNGIGFPIGVPLLSLCLLCGLHLSLFKGFPQPFT